MTVPYTFANQTGPIPLLELDQNFAAVSLNVDTAVTVTGNAQPNITSVGILNSLSLNNTIISLGANSSNSGNVFAIAIGANAGAITQRINAVAIGAFAGGNNQGGNSVAIGRAAGFYNQNSNAVAIGYLAGNSSQGDGSIAIGRAAGNSSQASNCIAIGRSAGNLTQGIQAIAIGQNAGNNSQGNQSLAIGAYAGNNNQGANSVAIGSYAGNPLMVANSICINGTAADLSAPNSGFFIAPIRNDNANVANVLYYNTSTAEVTYADTISLAGNITGNYILGNGSQLTGLPVQPGTYSNSNVSTFLADFGSNTISTSGNITTSGFFVGTFVGNIAGNLVVPGSNTQVLYNNDGNAGASTALTFDSASNVLVLTGNITASQFTGNGSTLSSITGANVTGTVANATFATTAGSTGSATTAGTVTSNAQANITSVGTLTSLTVSGNATASNLVSTGQVNVLGNVSASGFIGNGSTLSAITGANVTGIVPTAATVTTNAQPNITSVGTLTSLAVTGNTTSGNLLTGGQVSASGNITTDGYFLGTFAGNISGNLTVPGSNTQVLYNNNGNAGASTGFTFDAGSNALVSTGNITGANISTTGLISATGNVTGGNIRTNGTLVSFGANSIIVTGNIGTTSGNITTGLGTISGYNYLSLSTISAAGNITSNSYILGNGSQLTGISGPVVIATQTVYQNLATSPSTITQLPLIYDNVAHNIGNCYNSSTGEFIPISAGYYQINASIGANIAANTSYDGAGVIGLYLNGAPVAAGPLIQFTQLTIGNVTFPVTDQSSVSSLLYLNIGDTVNCELAYATDAPSNIWTTETSLVPSSFQACWVRGS